MRDTLLEKLTRKLADADRGAHQRGEHSTKAASRRSPAASMLGVLRAWLNSEFSECRQRKLRRRWAAAPLSVHDPQLRSVFDGVGVIVT
ncbi:MAG: hypothetical protein R3C58_03605 [Parvularculaceae bacterium]